MKIIEHKPDNTAYIHTLRNCTKFCTVNGYDFYEIRHDDGTYSFFVHIKGTADLCERLRFGLHYTDEGIAEQLNGIHDEQLTAFATAQGKLDHICAAVSAGQWTSNGDALFCELMGENELAEQVRKNRAAIYEQRAREEQERKAQYEAEQQARQELEQRKRLETMEQAEQKLRAGKFVTPEDFELLAEKYGVKLPIKFVGWLREYCKGIEIKPFTAEQKELYEGNYSVRYSFVKGHKSNTIGTYADQIATAAGL